MYAGTDLHRPLPGKTDALDPMITCVTEAQSRGVEMDDLPLETRWPLPNVWLGVSVEDQATADERIPLLLQTPAAVRFVSYEPALGPVDFEQWLGTAHCDDCETDEVDIGVGTLKRPAVEVPLSRWPCEASGVRRCGCGSVAVKETRGIDWIIAGGESGPGARPAHPDWFRSVRDQCKAAGVPFFFKQWGEWAEVPKMPSGYGRMVLPTDVQVESDGTVTSMPNVPGGVGPNGATAMRRLGKTKAGRLLDGVEHSEFP